MALKYFSGPRKNIFLNLIAKIRVLMDKATQNTITYEN